jgi:PAS domain S-box-containing protein
MLDNGVTDRIIYGATAAGAIRMASVTSQSAKLAANFSRTITIVALAGVLTSLGLWLATDYRQWLGLAAAAGLAGAGAIVYPITLRFSDAATSAGVMLLFVLLGAFMIPAITPALLPMGAATIVIVALTGQALLGAQQGLTFMLACMLALVVDCLFAQTISVRLYGEALTQGFMQAGLIVLGNIPAIIGCILLGRQIVAGYENTLSEDHRMLRLLIDSLPDNVFVKDRSSRMLIDNISHARLLGNSTPDEVIGKTDFDFFPAELAQKYYDDEQQIIQTGISKYNIEEPTIDPQGNERWLLTTKVLIRDESNEVMGIVGINRDITTLKAAEMERDKLLAVERSQRADLEALIGQIQAVVGPLNSAAVEILATAAQQTSSVVEQEAAIAQTLATVEEVRQTVEQTANRAQDVASAARESVKVSHTGAEAVIDSIEGMSSIKEKVEHIAENILALSERTQQIGEIIDTVNALAEQSKLLALNASIEAARAGEEGRGFAVVAMEVRQLAEQSRQATGRIRDILTEIQQATNTAVMVTEEGSKGAERGTSLVEQAGSAIRELAATIEEAAQAAAQIAASTHQQTSGMEQLSAAMVNIRAAATQHAASTLQMERSVQDLMAMTEQLEQAAERYSA